MTWYVVYFSYKQRERQNHSSKAELNLSLIKTLIIHLCKIPLHNSCWLSIRDLKLPIIVYACISFFVYSLKKAAFSTSLVEANIRLQKCILVGPFSTTEGTQAPRLTWAPGPHLSGIGFHRTAHSNLLPLTDNRLEEASHRARAPQ